MREGQCHNHMSSTHGGADTLDLGGYRLVYAGGGGDIGDSRLGDAARRPKPLQKRDFLDGTYARHLIQYRFSDCAFPQGAVVCDRKPVSLVSQSRGNEHPL